MSKFQLSTSIEDDVEEDVGSVADSWGPQNGENGAISNDGENSISGGSDIETRKGLSAMQKAAQQERSTLGVKETRAIFCLRLAVLLTLIMVGISFSLVLFYVRIAMQEQDFEDQFGFYGDQVFEKFNRQLERKLNSMDALSTDMTSYAKSSGSEFPFVTVPDFEFRGANARISGDSALIIYMPYITEDMKLSWEAYAAANRAYYSIALDSEQASNTAQDESFGLKTPEIDGTAREFLELMEALLASGSDSFTSTIWYSGIGGNAEPPYFPVWQMTPHVPVELINLDLGRYDFLDGALEACVNTGEVVFSVFTELTSNGDGEDADAGTFDLILQSGQYRHRKERYRADPMSAMIYPVFDGFGQDKKVVGVLDTSVYWRFLMNEILPENIYGIVCVMENSQGQKHAFEIRGQNTVYLGQDDVHDSKYDHMERSIDLVSYLLEAAGPESRSFTAAGVSGQFLNYTLRIYPTDDFREIFVTGEAAWDSAGVAMVFAVAICIFLVYDCCVQRRQRIVLERAVRATAVVSSLYPENIREHIINDDTNSPEKSSKRGNAFLRSELQESAMVAQPLASKYTDCTVFFADLAGFTKWSSTREPEQVFQLLETLFKEFDAAAAKWGVFKVETIGDSYMAVTGLPSPQPDHAVLMARFAQDCMHKLDRTVERLSAALGEGTDELALRTGMHSGEVTAGVLRGEKGRFQLFGDTVNTASRMESTGIPRRIQVSQSTADALILQGKGSWLVPRKDLVVAKGKGEMQTYFLDWKNKSVTTGSRSGSTRCLNI